MIFFNSKFIEFCHSLKYSKYSEKKYVLTYEKMYSSLHLSDLDQSRNNRLSQTLGSQKSTSSFYATDSSRSQISLIQKKSSKIRLYEKKIGNFERKLKDEKSSKK